MLKVAKLINGIGAGIARNILCTSTVDALTLLDHVLAYVANAKKRKTTKTARREVRVTYSIWIGIFLTRLIAAILLALDASSMRFICMFKS